MDPAQRLERLDQALERLEDAGPEALILVEGIRDAEALSELGVHTPVRVYNQGRPMLEVAESLRGEKRVIVLFDWDRKGGQLTRLLKEQLGATHRLDFEIRRELAIVSLVKCVEDLPHARRTLLKRIAAVDEGV